MRDGQNFEKVEEFEIIEPTGDESVVDYSLYGKTIEKWDDDKLKAEIDRLTAHVFGLANDLPKEIDIESNEHMAKVDAIARSAEKDRDNVDMREKLSKLLAERDAREAGKKKAA